MSPSAPIAVGLLLFAFPPVKYIEVRTYLTLSSVSHSKYENALFTVSKGINKLTFWEKAEATLNGRNNLWHDANVANLIKIYSHDIRI